VVPEHRRKLRIGHGLKPGAVDLRGQLTLDHEVMNVALDSRGGVEAGEVEGIGISCCHLTSPPSDCIYGRKTTLRARLTQKAESTLRAFERDPANAILRSMKYQRIATEEAFATPEQLALYRHMLANKTLQDPGFQSLWGFYLGSPSPRAMQIIERLQ